MQDALTHFFANNVILTIIVIAVIVMGVRSGLGVFRKLVFVIVVILVVLMLAPSCGQYVSHEWHAWNKSVWEKLPDWATSKACEELGIGDACGLVEMGNKADAGVARQMQCIEDTLAANGSIGAAVKSACGLRGDPPDPWEACVSREADKYEGLSGELIKCKSYSTSQFAKFARDLIEPFTCLFGQASCTTSDSKKASEPAYVYNAAYSRCLNDVAAQLTNMTKAPIWSKSCFDMPEGKAKDDCYIASYRSHMPADKATEWIAYCAQLATH